MRPADVRAPCIPPQTRAPARPACRLLLRARVALSFVLIACTAPVAARDYIVELVLFEATGELAPGGEGYWITRPRRAVTLGSDQATELGIVPSDAPLTLVDSAAAMNASGRYRVLQHLAWQQPGFEAKDAVRLRFSLGPALELYVAEDDDGSGDFIPAVAAPLPDRPKAVRTGTLSGTIRLRLGRFLHLESVLSYTDIDSGRSYRLNESRKMRSRELHYIDNPRFGILTRIVPADDPADESEEAFQADALEEPIDEPAEGESVTAIPEDGGEPDDTVETIQN